MIYLYYDVCRISIAISDEIVYAYSQLMLFQSITFPDSLQKLIIETVITWAKSDYIQDQELVREMFSLLHRQYDGVGEVCGVGGGDLADCGIVRGML